MSNNYVDQYGRYHDKPVTESNPVPSNNSWIYTAYAEKLGLAVDKVKLRDCLNSCQFAREDFIAMYHRSPNKPNPPMSRDEVLGIMSFGKEFRTTSSDNIIYNWNFSPYALPKFSAIKLVSQLWQLRPELQYHVSSTVDKETVHSHKLAWKHRNYFWQNNLDQLYRFAFSVPLTDRAFILKCWGETKTPRALFYRAIAFLDSKIGADSGIRWLKYGKSKEAMLKEFGEDHPFRS